MSQPKSIIKAKFFLSNFDSNSSIRNNTIFYFATYVGSVGLYIFNKLLNRKIFFLNNFIMIIKDIVYSYKYTGSKIFFSKKILNNYNKIYLTWTSYSNFKNDGSFFDRYLNISSKDLDKTLIIAIYNDKKLPTKIDNNILIFQTKEKATGLFDVIKNILKNFDLFFFNYDFFLAKISSHNFFSDILIKKKKFLLNKKIDFFLTPYEGQPFQNHFIMQLKNINNNIKCIGYIHSPPIPIPSNYIFRNYSPDYIVLNGKDQKYCFIKYLGWSKSKIKLLPSFRFLKNKSIYKNTIFLPYNIHNLNKIIKSLNYIIQKKIINPSDYIIRNHPATKTNKSKKIIDYFNEIKLKKNFSVKAKNQFLIFIGNTGSIIEYLERGCDVMHICDDDLFDFYNSKLWPSIISTKIGQGIYIYKIRKKGNLIKFGNSKKHNIKKILNSMIKLKNDEI